MTRAQKRVERLLRSRTSVSPDELIAALLGVGFVLRRQSGSHMTFSHPALRDRLTVPFHRPIKPIYVTLAYEAIKEVLAHDDGS